MGGRGGGSPGRQNSGAAATALTPGLTSEQRVIQAYESFGQPGEPIALDTFRERLTGLTRAEQDDALLSLASRREIRLIPEENRQSFAIFPGYKEAGINISGEEKHLIMINR